MAKYPAIIVVEGTSDVSLLSSFLEADCVVTNGSDIPESTIEYLLEASKTRDIVVLTDPDFPGKRIRDVLDSRIPGLKHAFVMKEFCIKHHKVGIAESDKEHILEALNNVITQKDVVEGNLAMSDLYELGLMGQKESAHKRYLLEKNLHLGHANAKTLLKRINALGLDLESIKEAIHE